MAWFRATRSGGDRDAVEDHVLWFAGLGPRPSADSSVGDVTLAEVLSLLVRRKWGTADVRDVTAFVATVLGGRRARAAEAVIRGELGEPELADPRLASLDELRDISWALLRALVQDWAPTPDQVTVVLDHAARSAAGAVEFLRRNKLTAAEAPAWYARKRAGSWTESPS